MLPVSSGHAAWRSNAGLEHVTGGAGRGIGMKKTDEEITIAAAIEFDREHDSAPRVTAKGRGTIAEKIIGLAMEHDVPVRKDPALVQVLNRLDINENIPPELYRAVAEILAFVYALNERRRHED